MANGYRGRTGNGQYYSICPIRNSGKPFKYSRCLGNRCQWWSYEKGSCAIWEIVGLLEDLVDTIRFYNQGRDQAKR